MKVINEDEYESEAPKQYEMNDPNFQNRSDYVQPHELTDDESFAVDRLVNNAPRNEPIPEPVSKPQQFAPIKPGFHQIRDDRVFE